jgi:CxxC motif-containing protein (DUF1111 family)
LSLLFDVILTDAIPAFHDYILKQGDLQMIFTLRRWLIDSVFVWSIFGAAVPLAFAQSPVPDPGSRPVVNWNRIGGWPSDTCPNNLVVPVPGLTSSEQKLFCAGADEFAKEDKVKEDGLGPTMNFISCFGCHQYPRSGGSSPLGKNPQYEFAKSYPPGTNVIPPFVRPDGPIMIARFKKHLDGNGKDDGGVHALFTITGLDGADGCILKQEDFAKEIARDNLINRIPTPTFGAGLIEQIEDKTIVDNVDRQAARAFGDNKTAYIRRAKLNLVQPFHTNGSENRNGNDGTIARFGWKAQNKSLLVFAGEAYNVEIGISNEVFPTEREEKTECQFHTVPNDTSHPENLYDPALEKRLDSFSDVEKFAAFMRLLAPPEPSTVIPGGAESIRFGAQVFERIGCSTCHTPELRTSPISSIPALRDKPVRLYSDLALHDMGKLGDGIAQGLANGNEFRSAPLWGLGQRVFFLHDGRTSDLVEAIEQHESSGSDANQVIGLYKGLSNQEKQNLLNFLRSL